MRGFGIAMKVQFPSLPSDDGGHVFKNSRVGHAFKGYREESDPNESVEVVVHAAPLRDGWLDVVGDLGRVVPPWSSWTDLARKVR
jgi:hypothetical protein